MSIEARMEGLRQTKPHELALRFGFGGLCTMLAGLIAKHWGPAVGGLFLAFPAIFPAGASLIERHETDRKHKAGMHGEARGRATAGVDAAGAAMGCVGLAVFAAVVWRWLPGRNAVVVIGAATAAWLAMSMGMWWVMRRCRVARELRRQLSAARRRIQ